MTKKLTNQEFLYRLKNKYGDEYTPLEDYKGYDKQIKLRHNKCNTIIKLSPNKLFTSNRKCNYCYGKINRSRTSKSYKNEISNLSNEEYKVLGDYIGYNEPIEVLHVFCGNKYFVSPSNFIAGYRCPECAKGKHDSKIEKEILDYIKNIYKGSIIENSRKILKGKELDIYLPDIKLAIEYNGYYWHNKDHKDRYYHLNKYNECLSNNITLITIWEDEYLNNKNKYLNIINQFINNIDIDYDNKYYDEYMYINKDYCNLDNEIYDDETNIYYEYIGDTLPELINRNNNECWNIGYKIYKEIKKDI